MKRYWIGSLFSFLVLSAVAIWMGGLNQDEGWLLYAAKAVASGEVPYRDFFFTQGPVMPYIYGAHAVLWAPGGILGARVFTWALAAIALIMAVLLARRLAGKSNSKSSGLIVFLLLGSNLYHLYYTSIPKTYALAMLFMLVGLVLLSAAETASKMVWRFSLAAASGAALVFSAFTRVSLGAGVLATGLVLIVGLRKAPALGLGYAFGALSVGSLMALPLAISAPIRNGFIAANSYHAARAGFDLMLVVGSLSRLVRFYLPIFVIIGWVTFKAGWGRVVRSQTLVATIAILAAVGIIQLCAPMPYDDYQVPVMALAAVLAAVGLASLDQGGSEHLLLVLGMVWSTAFSSPLLEQWKVNGQDRFWVRSKSESELAQLQKVAARIETEDPGGKLLLTQDLYLAIETNRQVPKGLEMGPFSQLSDQEWRKLLMTSKAPIAALSGYTFSILPPSCVERPMSEQLEYWRLLKSRYEIVDRELDFGQNATPLLILKRKAKDK